ncbi:MULTISPECIES: SagB/ThcOx family dehydrogenase [unclassified Acidovorax]|uniref:SagB/ThcOx family dehydrogenase n=1 Tax=unclassified Acidovorax TaxID=2684926 RepID=UPI0023DE611D|nr:MULTISPECIES: SagB/ThcOx family dehydrogenase [unclassified Acidovorax]GKS93756.1 hypothetical protein AVAK2825_04495 [Acidovorax sp. SUPP2825]GKS99679.1 hypothetical protein AVKW3434_09845 [Acidovorax sp. SUPP3434]
MKWLQPSHFLKIDAGKLIFWDYEKHQQFEITPKHLNRLLEFSTGAFVKKTQVDEDISNAEVLVDAFREQKWSWDWLSHIFHYGTQHPLAPESMQSPTSSHEYAASYLDFCASIRDAMPPVEIIKGGTRFALPDFELKELNSANLWESLLSRRTCRDFDSKPVSLRKISTLLYCAFGDIKADENMENLSVYGYKRTSPAAGGLQCTEPYLWAINIEGLPSGIYHYLSKRHELEFIKALPEEPIGTYLCHQDWANDMAFAIVMTSRFDKMWWKYPHSRAYRPMLMEVGHLSQTLNLLITAMELKPWLTGYFHDRELAEILECSADIEHPILVVGGGTGSGNSVDRITRKITGGV